MRLHGVVVVAALVALSTAATGCSSPGPAEIRDGARTIVVGVSGDFAENKIVAEMYALVLEHAGYTVERQFDLRSREVSQSALELDQIDVKPEYLSSLLLFLDPGARASSDPADVVGQDTTLLEPRGITMLTPSPAADTNQFVVNAQTSHRFHLTTLSSLGPVAGRLTFGGPPECPLRYFCIPGLHEVYGITFNDFVPLDEGGPLTVAALKSNEVQVGLLFSTDPSIDANRFVRLADDKYLQNAENITPVIRTEDLNDQVRRLLDGVSAALTDAQMIQLVGKVVLHGQNVTAVAKAFLTTKGLI